MKAKTWLTFFAVVSLLLIAAAGVFCFLAAKKYSEAKTGWDNKLVTIKALSKKEPQPTSKNVGVLEGIVTDYKQSVTQLFESLNKFQKPLKEGSINVIFRDSMTQRVGLFRDFAATNGLEINQDEFGLGFERYSDDLPLPEIVPVLEYELDAIEYLLKMLVESDVDSLDTFTRDVIPGEAGGPKEQEISTVHKYPVRIGFRSSHKAFQSFMNRVSNDTEYFYIVRVLSVNNESPDGPFKGDGLDETLKFEAEDTRSPASIEQMAEWGWGTGATDDQITAEAAKDGYRPSGKDARVLMGQEKLDVFMIVDIVRFLDPESVEIKQKGQSKRKARKGQR